MNKKIATFLFAIGLGAASTPAFASCYYYCSTWYNQCIADGFSVEECAAELNACQADCRPPAP